MIDLCGHVRVESATIGFVLALALPTGLYLLFTYQIQSGLKIRHNVQWVAMGSPQFQTASPSAMGKILKFCWSKQVKPLQDAELRKQVAWWRVFALWTAAGYLLLLTIMIKAAIER